MKFEHLLRIYWTRGLYFNGKLYNNNWSVKSFFFNLKGLNLFAKNNFIKRFEYGIFFKLNNEKNFYNNNINKRKIFNIFFSQLTSVNNNLNVLLKFILLRLYLIKTYRGRAQSLGKPCRGQRTWSNAWNAYKCNKILKQFVEKLKKIKQNIKKKKKNYKLIEKKQKKIILKPKKKLKKKDINLWF